MAKMREFPFVKKRESQSDAKKNIFLTENRLLKIKQKFY
jgi:hypothetical protein